MEATDNNEKNCKRFIEKLAATATALGWPEQIVDVLRSQMQSITEMQIKTIDRIMDTWEEQLKSPIAASSSAMPSNAKPSPSSGAVGSPLHADVSQMTTMIPLQFWMEKWQKPWTETMMLWANVNKPNENGGGRGQGKTT
jgi:hypothetical protein